MYAKRSTCTGYGDLITTFFKYTRIVRFSDSHVDLSVFKYEWVNISYYFSFVCTARFYINDALIIFDID